MARFQMHVLFLDWLDTGQILIKNIFSVSYCIILLHYIMYGFVMIFFSFSPPRLKKPLVPIIKKNDRQQNFSRGPPGISSPSYRNLIFTSSDDEFAKMSKNASSFSAKRATSPGSPKFAASHHALCTNQVMQHFFFFSFFNLYFDKFYFQGSNKATSSQGVQHTYDFLFDRHLKVLTTMDQDEEELYNEDHLRAIGE